MGKGSIRDCAKSRSESPKLLGDALWPTTLAPIVIPLATGIVQFATGNEEL